jgi:hypothetical protein
MACERYAGRLSRFRRHYTGENHKSANIMARSLNRLRLRLLKNHEGEAIARTIAF